MATHEQFASKKAFLFLFSLANIMQGMYSTYFVSTLTTIERLYEIQSKTVGAIMSATEFGQIIGSLLVSYYGGKGNKPRWISVCMTLSALAAIVSTSPHFLLYINNNHSHSTSSLNSFSSNNNHNIQQEHYSIAPLIGQGQLCSSSVIPHQQQQQQQQQMITIINTSSIVDNNHHQPHQDWSENQELHQTLEEVSQQQANNYHRQQQQHTISRMKQPTEIIFVIFFFSLLVIGFGSTAMTTLGIPFIDEIVSREESPLYLGVTIGLRIFGPALGFLLGSVCIQLNVNFPYDTTTFDEANQTDAINWIGAWWLGLILISVPLLLLASPMYYFSLIMKKDPQIGGDNKDNKSKNFNLEFNDGSHRNQSNKRYCHSDDEYYTDKYNNDHNHHEDDHDDGHDINEKIIVSSALTSPTPSPLGNLTGDSLDCLHNNNLDQHYIEYRLNDAYVDHDERLSQKTTDLKLSNKTARNNEDKRHNTQIHSNLRSIDTGNFLSLNMTKFNKTHGATIKSSHSDKNCSDDVDSVITKSSLDLSSGSSVTFNNLDNQHERRRRYLSSSTSASSDHHHHNHDNQDQHHRNNGDINTSDNKYIKGQKIKTAQQQQRQRQLQKQNNKINSLSNSIRRLMRNKLFMLRLLSTVLHLLPIAGFYTFLPKYLVEQFRVTASTASAISGLAGILFVGFGAFIGGSLMRIFNINSKCVTRWIASSALAYAIGLLILMQLGCPQENLVTYDMTMKDSSNINHHQLRQDSATELSHLSCTNSCNCRQSVYNPICVEKTTYLSPCLAGCTNYTRLDNQRIIYNDCKCHMVAVTSNNNHILDFSIDDLSVTSGHCINNCGNLKWYIMVFSLFVLIHATCEVGSMMLNLRCVDSKDRTLALGMVTFASSLLGTIPCSIIYGSVIDLTCIYWDTSEPESLISSSTNDQTNSEQSSRGACRLYDNDKFRVYLHGLTALVMIFAFIVDTIICRKAGKIDFFQQSTSDKEHTDRTQIPDTTTPAAQGSSLKHSTNEFSDNFTMNRDEEDDGVADHTSEDEDSNAKPTRSTQKQVAIDCAAIR